MRGDIAAKLDQARRVSADEGCFSWTSPEYQRDILEFICAHRDCGSGIIEVGTYKGGLTAQLSLICREYGWPLWTMDVDTSALETASNLLNKLGLADNVTFHCGALDRFVQSELPIGKPVLVVLDGDHRYDAVRRDICSIYKLPVLPYAAAFHDYSLRHPSTGERVDQAVRDELPHLVPTPIGARMMGNGPYPTQERPSEDGHWWEVPGSEGAIVELKPRPRRWNPMVLEAGLRTLSAMRLVRRRPQTGAATATLLRGMTPRRALLPG